jgi:abnormal spindle-like microcephaly-associated protein
MNPTEFASTSNTLRQPPRRACLSVQPSASLYSSDAAPQGIVSRTESLLRDRKNQNLRSRAPFSELHVNGGNSFGREDSPDPQISAALRTIRDLTLNDTTTSLTNPTDNNEIAPINGGRGRPSRQSMTSRPAARRPVSAILAERLAVASRLKEHNDSTDAEKQALLRREARRRTIYVPDDTTVLTIHPGASLVSGTSENSSLAAQRAIRRGSMLQKEQPRRRKSVMPISIQEEEAKSSRKETTDLPQLPALKSEIHSIKEVSERKGRRTSLAVAPRRMKIARDVALPTLLEDSNSKPNCLNENQEVRPTRPPLESNRSLQNIKLDLKQDQRKDKPQSLQKKPVRHSISVGHKRELSNENIHLSVHEKVAKTYQSSNFELTVKSDNTSVADNRSQSHRVLHSANSSIIKSSVQSSLSRSKQTNTSYSVLKEDLAHPEMYEENWLEHQEIALTQLLNAFFQFSNPESKVQSSQCSLRSTFLEIYNGQDMPQLMKRLQASLMYGSLTIPHELLLKSIRLKDDIGQRRKFLNLFLEVYNLQYLQAAAEAVIGKECQMQDRTSTESATGKSPSRSIHRRNLEAFLDKFFVQHDDVVESKTTNSIAAIVRDATDQVGSPNWAWRRTVMRSLMLVLILDMAKSLKKISKCLFQEASSLKSSEAVIRQLGAILLPSYGDIMRPLKHLRYEVSVQQHPLEEFKYEVENLAVDLRDGVRLTKVIEIILYEFYENGNNEIDETGKRRSVPNLNLSQDLKYPCISRTQQLHNVMIALSAMVHLPSISEKVLKDVSAFDIVDGHREKTLSLLWALLGQYSMDYLVDWDLLKREITHHQGELGRFSTNNPEPDLEDISSLSTASMESCWNLLFIWARTIATLHNCSVTNLTTSFADGNAFSAIISSYSKYFPNASSNATDTSPTSTLRTLGCSTSFTSLLLPSHATIPTKSFTLTSLTFLASRLLPAARSHRAASTIQSFYRRVLARREVHRRVSLMRLAAHCAAVVNARDHVVWAATVMQRAWRRVLDGKIRALEGDVRRLQAVARGWLVRKRVVGKGAVGKVGVRAGW